MEGILKIANVLLSIVAGIIAITLFKVSHRRKELNPWRILIIALIFFAVQQTLGALRAFRIYETPYLTHIVPTIILGLLIFALILQVGVTKK